MAIGDSRLPEGTDTIVDDGTTFDTEHEGSSTAQVSPAAEKVADTAAAAAGEAKSTFETLKQSVLDQTAEFRGQAEGRARDFAGQGKDKATEALDHVAQLVNDAAAQVEEKIGPEYAAYARRAAEAVTGAADGLRSKDIDALLEDAKEYVRSTPAVAIGAAAALGFVVARLAKSGLPVETDTAPDAHHDKN